MTRWGVAPTWLLVLLLVVNLAGAAGLAWRQGALIERQHALLRQSSDHLAEASQALDELADALETCQAGAPHQAPSSVRPRARGVTAHLAVTP